MNQTEVFEQLPSPFAVHLAKHVRPKKINGVPSFGATADDEGTSNATTYTDD